MTRIQSQVSPRWRKIPTVTRSFWLGVTLGVASPALGQTSSPVAPRSANASTLDEAGFRAATTGEMGTAPLDEDEVARIAATRSPASLVALRSAELAEARSRSAGLLPNPSLSWARETVDTGPAGGQGSQDIFSLAVPVDVARPLTRRSLAASESAWQRAEASLSRTVGVLEAVLAYYEVVLAQRRVEILAQSVSNLEEAARVLARRAAVGSASGYESSRLTIASELGQSRLSEARGSLESARARLGGLLGLPATSLRVSTELAFSPSRESTATARKNTVPQPAIAHARQAEQLAGEAEERARWTWLPSLEVAAGWKRADSAGEDDGYGYAATVSLGIPLFDHGQAERREAQAQHALASARSEALSRTLDADAQGALATYRAARQELRRFEAQTTGRVETLLVAARSGYREGERSIVELLDAQRAQTDVAEQRLSLLLQAKRAEARLRAARGELVQ